MRATWVHWSGRGMVSAWYHLNKVHSPTHTNINNPSAWRVSFPSFSSVPKHFRYPSFRLSPSPPLAGWQSWVVKHLVSELSLLYSHPGQQDHSAQSSLSWQPPHCITMASASAVPPRSAPPCFMWGKSWIKVKYKVSFTVCLFYRVTLHTVAVRTAASSLSRIKALYISDGRSSCSFRVISD